MSSAVSYREDFQDKTESLNTGQCKTLIFPTGKTLLQVQSAVKVNDTLGLWLSSRHLHTYGGFLARHLAWDGETEAQDGSSTCVKSCNESVTDPEAEGRNLSIPIPLSDPTARGRPCTRTVGSDTLPVSEGRMLLQRWRWKGWQLL